MYFSNRLFFQNSRTKKATSNIGTTSKIKYKLSLPRDVCCMFWLEIQVCGNIESRNLKSTLTPTCTSHHTIHASGAITMLLTMVSTHSILWVQLGGNFRGQGCGIPWSRIRNQSNMMHRTSTICVMFKRHTSDKVPFNYPSKILFTWPLIFLVKKLFKDHRLL